LRGDCRLGAETLLRGPREIQQPRHLEKSFELIEVHRNAEIVAGTGTIAMSVAASAVKTSDT
jgi:hypothetical protein